MALISVAPAKVQEGPAGGIRTLYFLVSLSAPVEQDVRVDYATADGSGNNLATAGQDYTAIASGTLTVRAGQTQGIIAVEVLGDAVKEASESFNLVLSNPVGAGFVKGTTLTAKGTIEDPSPTLTVAAVKIAEGPSDGNRTLIVPVTLSAPAQQDVVVHYASADSASANAATAGIDYQAVSGSLTIRAGQTAGAIAVNILGDGVKEANESFNLVFSDPLGAGFAKGDSLTAAVTIQDNAPLISVAAANVVEGVDGASSDLVFTVALSAPAQQTVTVDYATADGSGANPATAGSDYIPELSGRLTILEGRSAGYITVAIPGDAVREASENFKLILSSPVGAGFTKGDTLTATGTIVDPSPTLTVTPAKLLEGGSGDSRTMLFAVTLSVPALQDVSVSYSTQESGLAKAATAGEDFLSVNGAKLTIPAGQSAGYIPVTILGDNVQEANEVFNLVLTDPVGAGFSKGSSLTAVGTILDDESVPVTPKADFVLTPAKASERGFDGAAPHVEFPVILSAPADTTVKVKFKTVDGTGSNPALAGKDYVAATGELVFQPGETLKYVDVDILRDRLKETDESFSLNLYDARGAGLDTTPTLTATGTIVDDEPTLSVVAPDIREGNRGDINVLQIPVTLSAPAGNPVTVRYHTADGTGDGRATAGKDYQAISGTLRFDPGETTAYVYVTVLGDNIKEAAEHFDLILNRPKGAGFSSGTSLKVSPTLFDNEPVISATGAKVEEGNLGDFVALRFPVTLSEPTSIPVTVRYKAVPIDGPATATPGKDFFDPTGKVTFAPGETLAYITMAVESGHRFEPDESFDLVLFRPRGAGFADGSTLTVQGTISNDEPTITAVPATFGEGNLGDTGDMRFAVFLSHPYS
ncbi:MAG: hypothetical protein FIA97_08225, partial [Methylococcaceae bacterium]|nr:hypothetical protein [Methylococcaceae bacterium]